VKKRLLVFCLLGKRGKRMAQASQEKGEAAPWVDQGNEKERPLFAESEEEAAVPEKKKHWHERVGGGETSIL